METWSTYGYWGLFLSAFLAGSIIPFSAELLIGILLYQGFPLIPLVLVATLGNWLGGYTAFFMGYYARWDLIEKYFKINPAKIQNFKWKDKFSTELLALFCWIPILGSLILISLGLMRSSIIKTGVFMFIGRLVRYTVWALLSLEILEYSF
jgi:membrane protein YqaA with SNARE-associated domain|tara:strand:- start:1658 stop:2110 length:453 start_codon:yes stop_codon:yes gene_type:complete